MSNVFPRHCSPPAGETLVAWDPSLRTVLVLQMHYRRSSSWFSRGAPITGSAPVCTSTPNPLHSPTRPLSRTPSASWPAPRLCWHHNSHASTLFSATLLTKRNLTPCATRAPPPDPPYLAQPYSLSEIPRPVPQADPQQPSPALPARAPTANCASHLMINPTANSVSHLTLPRS